MVCFHSNEGLKSGWTNYSSKKVSKKIMSCISPSLFPEAFITCVNSKTTIKSRGPMSTAPLSSR